MKTPLDVNAFEEAVSWLKKETRQRHVIVTEEQMEAIYSALASKGGLWIPVKNALPEEGKNVLIYIERDAMGGNESRRREIAIGCQIDGKWYEIDGKWYVNGCSRVEGLYWMPLPKPPEEDEP